MRALGIEAEICHLNEGHAAFAALERARCYMEDNGVPFEEALTATRAGNLFTTHTAVEAGFDRFPPALVKEYLGELRRGARDRTWSTPRPGPPRRRPAETFNMAFLAIRASGAVNGVSRLHGEVSRRLFQPLFPRWPREEVPIGHVTNGVHVPSWDSPEADALWTKVCGKGRWLGGLHGLTDLMRGCRRRGVVGLSGASPAQAGHHVARDHVRRQGPIAGSLEALGSDLSCLCDPAVLTLGFARRFATYKRLDLLLHDPDRLERILCGPNSRIQLILAGKAHPADTAGKAMIKQVDRFHRPQRRPPARRSSWSTTTWI